MIKGLNIHRYFMYKYICMYVQEYVCKFVLVCTRKFNVDLKNITVLINTCTSLVLVIITNSHYV